jgi:hypothetical protein
MRPTLVVNPVTDREFGAFAEAQLGDGAKAIGEFQVRLRVRYPLAAVHARDLAGEQFTVWYVYRDGHWTDPRSDHGRPKSR